MALLTDCSAGMGILYQEDMSGFSSAARMPTRTFRASKVEACPAARWCVHAPNLCIAYIRRAGIGSALRFSCNRHLSFPSGQENRRSPLLRIAFRRFRSLYPVHLGEVISGCILHNDHRCEGEHGKFSLERYYKHALYQMTAAEHLSWLQRRSGRLAAFLPPR